MKHENMYILNTIKKAIFHKTILLLLCTISFARVSAQQALSLEDCIGLALENNFQLRIVRNYEQIGRNNNSLGNAGMLPTLQLNSGANASNNSIERNYNDGTSAETQENNSNLNVALNFNWTIFEGFKLWSNYQKLNELEKMGELNTKINVENLIAQVSAGYYKIVQENMRLQNIKSSIQLSKERLRIVEERYNIGQASRLDLQQARVDFNTDSSKIIRQNELINNAKIELKTLMALNNKEIDIAPIEKAIEANYLLEKDALWKDTEMSNLYLESKNKEKQISEIELKALRGRNFPYLRLNAAYGFNQMNYSNANISQQNNAGLNYGLTLGFQLFDGMNRVREQRNARIAIENKSLELEQLLNNIRGDFEQLWMSYRNNNTLRTLEKESVANAAENYEIAMERYKLGNLSGFELREAQNNLLAAEERLLDVEYRIKLVEISLLQISNSLVKSVYNTKDEK